MSAGARGHAGFRGCSLRSIARDDAPRWLRDSESRLARAPPPRCWRWRSRRSRSAGRGRGDPRQPAADHRRHAARRLPGLLRLPRQQHAQPRPLASQGVLFEDTISVIGKTGPAFASLFSSLYPPTHGARRNGVRMREDVPVLAEKLRDAGYTTGAFISNWTLKSHLSGTHRGFDLYDDENFDRERNSFGAVERDAADVTQAALRWLESVPADRPDLPLGPLQRAAQPLRSQGRRTPPRRTRRAKATDPARGATSTRARWATSTPGSATFLARAEKRLPAASTLTRLPERSRREPRRARLLGPRQEHALAEPAHPADAARARASRRTARRRRSVDRRRDCRPSSTDCSCPLCPAPRGKAWRRAGSSRIPIIICASPWASARPRSPRRAASTTTIRS